MAKIRKTILPAATAAPPAAARRRSNANFALFLGGKKKKQTFWALGIGIAVFAAVVMALYAFTEFDLSRLRLWIDDLNPFAVIPLMAVLPVLGFPVSVVYLVAGARFGPWWGGVVVTVATATHLALTYLISNSFLRAPLQRFIAKRHFHLPQIPVDEQPAIALVAALAPGLPYVVRNYLLALAGVRLRVLLWVCLPVYVARSYVTILLGDLGSDLTRRRLLILVGVDSLKFVICAGVIWWLRRHHRKYHGHEDDAAHAGAATTGGGR
jgi:uncharacterized membrane protein YdjX (TVP38/TMEM64 family)